MCNHMTLVVVAKWHILLNSMEEIDGPVWRWIGKGIPKKILGASLLGLIWGQLIQVKVETIIQNIIMECAKV